MGFISSKHLYKGLVKTEHLDELIDIIIKLKVPNVFPLNAIVAGVKIAAYFAYITSRKTLIDQQLEIEKQEYEQKQTNNNGQGMDDNPVIKPSDLDG